MGGGTTNIEGPGVVKSQEGNLITYDGENYVFVDNDGERRYFTRDRKNRLTETGFYSFYLTLEN